MSLLPRTSEPGAFDPTRDLLRTCAAEGTLFAILIDDAVAALDHGERRSAVTAGVSRVLATRLSAAYTLDETALDDMAGVSSDGATDFILRQFQAQALAAVDWDTLAGYVVEAATQRRNESASQESLLAGG